ncbi:MAG: nicotinamide riboside transporter PnuC [Flavitalea sp.]
MDQIFEQFVSGIHSTTWLEFIAVIFGIASVVFSRMENILVYPTGLVNTILYTYFCFSWWGLYAEGSLNFYYTVMSIYGWVLWTRQDKATSKKLQVTSSSSREWIVAIIFFLACWAILYFVLKKYTDSNVPWGDSFASASAYTGMWLMARKKLENWIWWILTNLASIPLYFYKGAVFISVQYLVFLILAILGFITWRKKISHGTN